MKLESLVELSSMRFPLTALLGSPSRKLQTRPRFFLRMASTTAPAAGRTYADAINLLNSLQSNAAVIEAIRKGGGKSGDQLMEEMIEYLTRIGYQVSRLRPRPPRYNRLRAHLRSAVLATSPPTSTLSTSYTSPAPKAKAPPPLSPIRSSVPSRPRQRRDSTLRLIWWL